MSQLKGKSRGGNMSGMGEGWEGKKGLASGWRRRADRAGWKRVDNRGWLAGGMTEVGWGWVEEEGDSGKAVERQYISFSG